MYAEEHIFLIYAEVINLTNKTLINLYLKRSLLSTYWLCYQLVMRIKNRSMLFLYTCVVFYVENLQPKNYPCSLYGAFQAISLNG